MIAQLSDQRREAYMSNLTTTNYSQPADQLDCGKAPGQPDRALDMAIELIQILSRYPIFEVAGATNLPDLELCQVGGVNVELEHIAHVAGALVACVPVARDLL